MDLQMKQVNEAIQLHPYKSMNLKSIFSIKRCPLFIIVNCWYSRKHPDYMYSIGPLTVLWVKFSLKYFLFQYIANFKALINKKQVLEK